MNEMFFGLILAVFVFIPLVWIASAIDKLIKTIKEIKAVGLK